MTRSSFAAANRRMRDFVPTFFTFTGLRTDLGSMGGRQAWMICAIVIAVASGHIRMPPALAATDFTPGRFRQISFAGFPSRNFQAVTVAWPINTVMFSGTLSVTEF